MSFTLYSYNQARHLNDKIKLPIISEHYSNYIEIESSDGYTECVVKANIKYDKLPEKYIILPDQFYYELTFKLNKGEEVIKYIEESYEHTNFVMKTYYRFFTNFGNLYGIDANMYKPEKKDSKIEAEFKVITDLGKVLLLQNDIKKFETSISNKTILLHTHNCNVRYNKYYDYDIINGYIDDCIQTLDEEVVILAECYSTINNLKQSAILSDLPILMQ